MLLIIGKNSRLVNSIEHLLSVSYDICSHRDLPSINFAKYNRVLLFSWSHKSLIENLYVLQSLPLNKTTFVSTVAVNALSCRRQISKYPSDKAFAENYVLNAGGDVLRLGVFEDEKKMDHFAYQVLTSPSDLASFINDIPKSTRKNRIVTLGRVAIKPSRAGVLRTLVIRSLAFLSYLFPTSFMLQAPLQLSIRKLGSSYYGYTGDSQNYCADTVVIGTGYTGAKLSRNLSPSTLFVQGNLQDRWLVGNGFNNTILGHYKNGITKFWHGVVIKFSGGVFVKTVPLFVNRPRIRNKIRETFISKISQYNRVLALSGVADNTEILCNKCIVSAGAIETAKLLKPLTKFNSDLYFDDHEIGCAGTISLSDAENSGMIRCISFLPIFVRGKVKRAKAGQLRLLIDARPVIENENKDISNEIYANRVSTIIFKLIKLFSFELINSAFYNKFGYGFRTNRLEIHYQIEVRDCIKLATDNRLTRRRLQADHFMKLENVLKNGFESYIPVENWCSNDAQHVVGGKNCDKLFHAAKAHNVLAASLLPGFRLFEVHHTVRYARYLDRFMDTFYD